MSARVASQGSVFGVPTHVAPASPVTHPKCHRSGTGCYAFSKTFLTAPKLGAQPTPNALGPRNGPSSFQ